MTRALRLAAAPALVVLVAAALAGGSPAQSPPPGSPFYLVPQLTRECLNVKGCVGVVGPWVVVPARGQATYMLTCPTRRGYIVAGTDARASSGQIRVWFDGKLGGPLGTQQAGTRGSGVLLFHAVANNRRQGSFQPIVGCVSLTPRNRRSTVGVLPGQPPSAPLDLRTEQVGLRLSRPLLRHSTVVACPKGERLVGKWHAVAVATLDPPHPAYGRAVTVRTRIVGGKVHATYGKDRLFTAFAPRSWAQIGAMCEP